MLSVRIRTGLLGADRAVCWYRVCVEETRKGLSYLSAIGAVTTEGNFNTQALWRIVSGASKSPTLSTPVKDGEEDKLEAWQVKADKAAGIMWLMLLRECTLGRSRTMQ